MHILVVLGVYFDAVVVFVTNVSLLLRFGPGHTVVCNILCTTTYVETTPYIIYQRKTKYFYSMCQGKLQERV